MSPNCLANPSSCTIFVLYTVLYTIYILPILGFSVDNNNNLSKLIRKKVN